MGKCVYLYIETQNELFEMKRFVICILLCIWGLVPGFAQKQLDTVRAALISVNDPKKLIFTLEDGEGTLKVHLAGMPRAIAPGFYALDVRNGDTLTVAGIRKAPKHRKKNESEMVSAAVLGIDYAFDHDDRPGYYFSLDQKPTFQGGSPKAFSQWVNERLVYPDISRRTGSEGTVRLKFTIEKDGRLDNISILESSGDSSLDAEALRVVSSSPNWTPGSFHGKPVKVTFTFPVIFQLNKPKKNQFESSDWSKRR